MRFEFATANQIIFGPDTLREVGAKAAGWGRSALVCLGIPEERASGLWTDLREHGLSVTVLPVTHEPTVDTIVQGVELARQRGCDVVIGLGGGSALDSAKAVAALYTNPGDVLDYLEVVGQGRSLAQPPLPVLAIPTTAGTGAEVTRNAVIGAPAQRVKVSLRSPFLLPRLALVDPVLTYGLPPAVTASTGMDALTQLIEPYLSARANPVTDAFCRQGLSLAARSLRRAYEIDDPAARCDMSLAALLGGLALANAGLGVVHGFAGVLGGMLQAPHGALCAALLPHGLQANFQALQARQPGHPALSRFGDVSRILLGREADAPAMIAWIDDLRQALQIPTLGQLGLLPAQFPAVVENTLRASSTKANPIVLSPEELWTILQQAL